MLIIPAIDLQQGRCVRLKQGRFDLPDTYDCCPIELARHYASQGAQRLHVVDLDGAKTGELQQLPLIRQMQESGLIIQAGGGIRTLASAQNCFAAGIQQLVIGSIAVTNPSLTLEIIKQAGDTKIILALDVNINQGVPQLAVHGWQTATTISLWDIIHDYQQAGIRQVLCTDIACDGMLKGPNFDLYQQALKRFPGISWQASGGIRHKHDIDRLAAMGISAVILGRMLYESTCDLNALFKERFIC